MKERPDFLRQTKAQRERDADDQALRRARAFDRGLVPSKSDRTLDFLDRAIEETRKQIKARRGGPRAELQARLAHQLAERDRLSG